ncbi:lipase [Sphingorhabdus pulchriflava]|uniref:Lipase n=2 Tax=Sphingorhabdus pulchriflava TaxID=2292257 RepID=A0A371BI79_9SPHN|nr:lipase [Sphingorhabdus pulchriflava]
MPMLSSRIRRALLALVSVGTGFLFIPSPASAREVQSPPGTLIEYSRKAGAPVGAQAWRIRYVSRNEAGRPIEVTGVVIAPKGMPNRLGRPVLAWAHGTWGVADKCTPSASPNFFAATPALDDAIARGHVVVATDYEGLGTDGPHPYLVGGSAGRSVLDAIRAAQAIPEAGASRRFAVWGESQGGHASLWTGQIAKNYAPELDLVGVAAAAPPTDLIENLTSGSDPSIRAFLTAFTAHSWSEYFGAPLDTLGNKSTQGIINRLARNNCVTLGAKPRIGAVVGVLVLRQRLKDVNLGKISPWAEIARANSPARRDYGVPFLIAQNSGDSIVGPQVTRQFSQDLCRAGARVRWVPITSETGHPTSAKDSATETLNWIDARFAGERARSDCGNF